MIIGISRETRPGERRVALVPAAIPPLAKAGHEVLVETGAGDDAGFPDPQFRERGAEIAKSRAEVFARAEVLAQVNGPAMGRAADADLSLLRGEQALIAALDPLSEPRAVQALADCGVTAFALDLMPRITRAQSMDILSSMATVAGYKAVLLAAVESPRMFPLLMTAAGTVSPAKVLVVGAGVAGLQAIATARRLGALVEAYDIRPAVREQVESLGAKFVELPLASADAEDRGGYARAQDESFYRRQQELMARVVAANDVVITTAAVPGRRSPILVTEEMVRGMRPGSVIVDLAAERGGNCSLTRSGERVVAHGVVILGPVNLPAAVPYHASQLFAKNIANFLLHLAPDGMLRVDLSDEITRETLVARGGRVVHPRVLEALATAGGETGVAPEAAGGEPAPGGPEPSEGASAASGARAGASSSADANAARDGDRGGALARDRESPATRGGRSAEADGKEP